MEPAGVVCRNIAKITQTMIMIFVFGRYLLLRVFSPAPTERTDIIEWIEHFREQGISHVMIIFQYPKNEESLIFYKSLLLRVFSMCINSRR